MDAQNIVGLLQNPASLGGLFTILGSGLKEKYTDRETSGAIRQKASRGDLEAMRLTLRRLHKQLEPNYTGTVKGITQDLGNVFEFCGRFLQAT